MALERKAIGQHIARLRERQRLTQPKAAERVGVALRTYQEWEGGRALPYFDNLLKLAQVFETTPEDIVAVGGSGPSIARRLTHLERIVRRRPGAEVMHECEAVLIPDPDNEYDPNAVKVVVNGDLGGHLSREEAARWSPRLLTLSGRRITATCDALIVGREGGETTNLGVFLCVADCDDQPWPAADPA